MPFCASQLHHCNLPGPLDLVSQQKEPGCMRRTEGTTGWGGERNRVERQWKGWIECQWRKPDIFPSVVNLSAPFLSYTTKRDGVCLRRATEDLRTYAALSINIYTSFSFALESSPCCWMKCMPFVLAALAWLRGLDWSIDEQNIYCSLLHCSHRTL